MTFSSAGSLVAEIEGAHAAGLLASAEHLLVSFSSGGLAFASKGQPHALVQASARLSPARQEVMLTGQRPRPWTLDISDSRELAARLHDLRRGARRVRWEPEDVGAFAAGALWTYLMMPLLLAGAERVDRLPDSGGRRRIKVVLPPEIAGHGRAQTLHLGPTAMIERHDYTASAIGSWATAAQTVGEYRVFEGIPIATRRIVAPRLGATRLARPRLVWIEIHDVTLE